MYDEVMHSTVLLELDCFIYFINLMYYRTGKLRGVSCKLGSRKPDMMRARPVIHLSQNPQHIACVRKSAVRILWPSFVTPTHVLLHKVRARRPHDAAASACDRRAIGVEWQAGEHGGAELQSIVRRCAVGVGARGDRQPWRAGQSVSRRRSKRGASGTPARRSRERVRPPSNRR